MRSRPIVYACFAVAVIACGPSWAAGHGWATVLRSEDFVVGSDLQKLNTRHKWAWKFNAGVFEVAVRKTAISVEAPQCRMEYLILTMPMYYPENPAQATTEERQAVYDALVNIRKTGKGGLKQTLRCALVLTSGAVGSRAHYVQYLLCTSVGQGRRQSVAVASGPQNTLSLGAESSSGQKTAISYIDRPASFASWQGQLS